MSAVALQSFGFGERLVRVLDRDGSAWFVANDVCGALEIGNSRQALSRLEEDEKGVISSDTLGGQQQLSIVSESGMYALIFTSRKASAKQFRKWVTSEVLPTIRRTGRFEVANDDGSGFVEPQMPDEIEALRTKLAVAKEVRIVFGTKAARTAWRELALLPALTDALPSGGRIEVAGVVAKLHASVGDWLDERTIAVPGHRMRPMVLYDDYLTFSKRCGFSSDDTVSLTGFGRALSACGIRTVKSDNLYRVGLQLRD